MLKAKEIAIAQTVHYSAVAPSMLRAPSEPALESPQVPESNQGELPSCYHSRDGIQIFGQVQ
jgi:hypothetical protein